MKDNATCAHEVVVVVKTRYRKSDITTISSSLVSSHVTLHANLGCKGSATDLADKGLNVVRLPIPSGWEDSSVIIANYSPHIPVLA